MRTPAEVSAHKSIWDTAAWLKRREGRTGIKGGRISPLPLQLRRAIERARANNPQMAEKQGIFARAKNFVSKKVMPQKVV